MKGYTREVLTKVAFVDIDGEEFKFNELLEVVEELAEADGVFNRVIMHNPRMAVMLENNSVATRNARGSYGRGPKHKEFLDELYDLRLF